MRTSTAFWYLGIVVSLSSMAACEPDEPLITPPHDCSDDHTMPVINADTIVDFNCVSTVQTIYTAGISILEVVISPLDSNKMCFAIKRDSATFDVIAAVYEIWVFDQCSGALTLLGSDFNRFEEMNNISWGSNDRIIYRADHGWRVCDPNGSNMIVLPFGTFQHPYSIPLIKENGHFLQDSYINNQRQIVEYDELGNRVDTTPSLIGGIVDILPDGRLLGLGTEDTLISIYDQSTGERTIVDHNTIYFLSLRLRYVESLDAVMWIGSEQDLPFPQSVGYTSLATGQRTILRTDGPNRIYWGVDAQGSRLCLLRIEYGFIENCLQRSWMYAVLLNPDGTDERRLVLPF